MDDLEKFIDFLYRDQTGFVYSPVKSKSDFEQSFFAWPSERQALLDHVKIRGREHDVYICPSVFSKKEATKESFKSTKVVWVEFDGQEQIDFKDVPKPDCIVQTSTTTHLHCYWATELFDSGKAVDDINRRLTYYLKADSSGWDCTQLLRPPTSTNFKHDLPVTLAFFEKSGERKSSDFDRAPEVETFAVDITIANLQDPVKLLQTLPIRSSLKKLITDERVEVTQRSQFLFKIAHELAEYGLNHSQIATLIYYVDERIGKFSGRSDQLQRISELASIALHSVSITEAISLYSPRDILEHTDDLEWIFGNWLHSTGFMLLTGSPGVGKTQFAMQMAYHFANGIPFLEWEVAKRKVLVMSLEMDIRELKYIISHQTDGYSDLSAYEREVRFMDELGTFASYEDVIEEYSPQVIIVDSLIEIMDGDLKDGPEAKMLMRWFKRIRKKYQTAFVIIHHNRKATTSNSKPNKLEDVYGSMVFAKDTETGFSLWEDEESGKIECSVIKARFTKKEVILIERSEHLIFNRCEAENTKESFGPSNSILSFEA